MPKEPQLVERQNRKIALGRIVKFFISAIVFGGISFLQGVLRLLGISRSPRCMVLYYHSVPAEYRNSFAKQLDMMLRHARPVHPEQTDSLENGGEYCLITFDDGFTNFIEIALPDLASRKIPSLLFIITEALGKSFGPAKAPE